MLQIVDFQKLILLEGLENYVYLSSSIDLSDLLLNIYASMQDCMRFFLNIVRLGANVNTSDSDVPTNNTEKQPFVLLTFANCVLAKKEQVYTLFEFECSKRISSSQNNTVLSTYLSNVIIASKKCYFRVQYRTILPSQI